MIKYKLKNLTCIIIIGQYSKYMRGGDKILKRKTEEKDNKV